jgi:hypothetical protein
MNDSSLISDVARALADLPDVKLGPIVDGVADLHQPFDYAIDGLVKGREVRFLVETKANAYPRDIEYYILRLGRHAAKDESEFSVPLVAAPAITDASRQLLREHKIGYWDSSGSVYLDLPWATYFVDRPVPARQARRLRDVFRGSAAQVLHALLIDPERQWHLIDLAERAQVSASTAHEVCTFLEQQLWLEKAGSGRQAVRILQEPGAVLDAWAASHTLDEYQPRRYHRWARRRGELLDSVSAALQAQQIDHALTLSSGAELVAPHGTPGDRIFVLVAEAHRSLMPEAAAAAGLRETDEGETVTAFLVHDKAPMLFRRQVQGVWVASDVQLYLDLAVWPQRGKEQAQHLRAERIHF